MSSKSSVLSSVSRRMRLVLVTALLVLGTKVAAAALAPETAPIASGAARVSLPD